MLLFLLIIVLINFFKKFKIFENLFSMTAHALRIDADSYSDFASFLIDFHFSETTY